MYIYIYIDLSYLSIDLSIFAMYIINFGGLFHIGLPNTVIILYYNSKRKIELNIYYKTL